MVPKTFLIAAVLVGAVTAMPAVRTEEKCTAPGMRCAGEDGFPFVEYIGCCDGKECLFDKSKGWGRYCMDRPTDYGKGKCYETGERCMGSEGKPYVEYNPCCNAGDKCMVDESLGWGGFCKSAETFTTNYDEVKYVEVTPKCYKTNERCMGAVGYPFVQFHYCCEETEACVLVETDYYDASKWGGICRPVLTKKYKEEYGTYKPNYEYVEKFDYTDVGDFYKGTQAAYEKMYPESVYDEEYDYGFGQGKDVEKTKKPTITKMETKATATRPTITMPTVRMTTMMAPAPKTSTTSPTSLAGCGLDGRAVATAEAAPAPAFDATKVLIPVDYVVTQSTCSVAADNLSQAAVDAIEEEVCAQARAGDPSAVCYVELINGQGVSRMAMEDTSERQAGIIIIRIIIIAGPTFANAIIGFLQALGILPAGPTLAPFTTLPAVSPEP